MGGKNSIKGRILQKLAHRFQVLCDMWAPKPREQPTQAGIRETPQKNLTCDKHKDTGHLAPDTWVPKLDNYLLTKML